MPNPGIRLLFLPLVHILAWSLLDCCAVVCAVALLSSCAVAQSSCQRLAIDVLDNNLLLEYVMISNNFHISFLGFVTLLGLDGVSHLLLGLGDDAHTLEGLDDVGQLLLGLDYIVYTLQGLNDVAHILLGLDVVIHILQGLGGVAHVLLGLDDVSHVLQGLGDIAHTTIGSWCSLSYCWVSMLLFTLLQGLGDYVAVAVSLSLPDYPPAAWLVIL